VLGETFPRNGTPEDYLSGSPEAMLVSLFSFWMKRNFGKMAELLFDFSRQSMQQRAGKIRIQFGNLVIKDFTITPS
jgi:hypothetical protein